MAGRDGTEDALRGMRQEVARHDPQVVAKGSIQVLSWSNRRNGRPQAVWVCEVGTVILFQVLRYRSRQLIRQEDPPLCSPGCHRPQQSFNVVCPLREFGVDGLTQASSRGQEPRRPVARHHELPRRPVLLA